MNSGMFDGVCRVCQNQPQTAFCHVCGRARRPAPEATVETRPTGKEGVAERMMQMFLNGNPNVRMYVVGRHGETIIKGDGTREDVPKQPTMADAARLLEGHTWEGGGRKTMFSTVEAEEAALRVTEALNGPPIVPPVAALEVFEALIGGMVVTYMSELDAESAESAQVHEGDSSVIGQAMAKARRLADTALIAGVDDRVALLIVCRILQRVTEAWHADAARHAEPVGPDENNLP